MGERTHKILTKILTYFLGFLIIWFIARMAVHLIVLDMGMYSLSHYPPTVESLERFITITSFVITSAIFIISDISHRLSKRKGKNS